MTLEDPLSLEKYTLGSYLVALSESSPTPGGGAAAAVTLAQSCALYNMALRVSYKDLDQLLPHSPILGDSPLTAREVHDHLSQHQNEFILMGDQDIRVFKELMDCYRLPKATDQEKAVRHHEIQKKTQDSLALCLKMASLAHQTLSWGRYAVYFAKSSIISDSFIATELLVGGMKSSIINVRINLRNIDDKALVAKTSLDLQKLYADFDKEVSPLLSHCHKMLS